MLLSIRSLVSFQAFILHTCDAVSVAVDASFDQTEASTHVCENETRCTDNFSINILELDMFVRIVTTLNK